MYAAAAVGEQISAAEAYENAVRRYSFDPFAYISRAQAAVDALRKAAECHHVSVQVLSQQKKGGQDGNALPQPVKAGKLAVLPKGGGCHPEPSTARRCGCLSRERGNQAWETEWRRHGSTVL
jgi:hypothetical protein